MCEREKGVLRGRAVPVLLRSPIGIGEYRPPDADHVGCAVPEQLVGLLRSGDAARQNDGDGHRLLDCALSSAMEDWCSPALPWRLI